jgi:hypothetical protein
MNLFRRGLLMLLIPLIVHCSSSEKSPTPTGLSGKNSSDKGKKKTTSKSHNSSVQDSEDLSSEDGESLKNQTVPLPSTQPIPSPMPGPSSSGVASLHSPQPTTCGGCHESKRPAVSHYPGHDCSECHKYPSFVKGTFLHSPKPTECESCHARPTRAGLRAYPNQGPPAGFVATDPKAIGSGHYVGKDCSQCHETPSTTATKFAFSHSAPNPQTCLPCHFNQGFAQHGNRQYFTGFGTCTNCHSNFSVQTGRNFGRN